MVASRKINRGAIGPAAVRSGLAVDYNRSIDVMSQDEIRDHIGAVAAELAQLANSNKLDALAVACDVVREIAAGNVRSKRVTLNVTS
jgi:hypothetical protein